MERERIMAGPISIMAGPTGHVAAPRVARHQRDQRAKNVEECGNDIRTAGAMVKRRMQATLFTYDECSRIAGLSCTRRAKAPAWDRVAGILGNGEKSRLAGMSLRLSCQCSCTNHAESAVQRGKNGSTGTPAEAEQEGQSLPQKRRSRLRTMRVRVCVVLAGARRAGRCRCRRA